MLSVLQLDLLLAAVSALLPLVPAQHRDRAADILDAARDAANAAAAIGAHLGDLSQNLAGLRSEIDAMGDRAVTSEDMDRALLGASEASATFREALEIAPAPTT